MSEQPEVEWEHSIQCRMLDNDTDRCICRDLDRDLDLLFPPEHPGGDT